MANERTSIFDGLHRAFHAKATRAYILTERVVWVFIVLSVLLFIVDLQIAEDTRLHRALALTDDVLLLGFAVELLLRITSYRPPELAIFHKSHTARARIHLTGRLRYLLRPLQLADLLTVLALVPALRGLRAIRLLRLLRSAGVFRYSHPLRGISRAFQENVLLYAVGFGLLVTATIVGGLSIYLVEVEANPDISSVADGMWWAIVTLTTVGFGDITPVTPLGRVVGGTLMVAGMFTLALFAGIVGNTLLNVVLSIREEQVRMSGYYDHVVICGYDAGTLMLLDAVAEEVDLNARQVVIFAPRERPPAVPPHFAWIQGDPTKESELDKVRLTHAHTALLVGARDTSPSHADAQTILTVFTIRSHLSQRPLTEARKKPLYVVTEILDAENVDHARSAGADEVIETTRLGFSLLAHTINQPGTAALMGLVGVLGSQNIYVGPIPEQVAVPETFSAVAGAIKASTGALVIGLRGPAG
ncbi:MAG: ion transporter, partial [Myxococcota bacterium]|nr:ion transporter [Myxococcota bacterium]